ncbi:MAG: hypothetical protein ACK4TA_23010 [Saprospiraceae bacterium]
MSKTLLLSILLWLLYAIAGGFCQTSNPADATEQPLRTLATMRASEQEVKKWQLNPAASPFLFSDWQEGTGVFIRESQDTFSATALMNIDLLRQMLAVQFRDGAIGYISPMHLQELFIREKLYFLHNFMILPVKTVEGGKDEQLAFYEKLHHGKFTLLKRVVKRSQSSYALGLASVNESTTADVITAATYWLSTDQQTYKKINLRRKSLESTLPAKRTEIDALVKQHQLNLVEEKDVLRLLEFLEVS